MSRKTMSGIPECAKALALKRNCSLAEATGIMKNVLDVMEDEIIRVGGIQFVGRFTLEKYQTKERTGFNPKTGEPINIAAKNTLKLKVGTNLKNRIN